MRFASEKCQSKVRLDGKVALITGCNTGLGKETAKDFYRRGAKVLMACRDELRTEEAITDIQATCKGLSGLGILKYINLDLNALNSVRNCANKVLESETKLDILVNNAGQAGQKGVTVDGFEKNYGINYLGHFLLTTLLLPVLMKSCAARIVNVSSVMHYISNIDLEDLTFRNRWYTVSASYGQSKLALIMFTRELADRLKVTLLYLKSIFPDMEHAPDARTHREFPLGDTNTCFITVTILKRCTDRNMCARSKKRGIYNVRVYSLQPGFVKTEIGRNLNSVFFGMRWIWNHVLGLFFKSVEAGSQTIIYCSLDEKCAQDSGLYYSDCKIITSSRKSRNEELCKQVWEKSSQMVGFSSSFTI